jgi:DNA modification methylase
MTVLDKYYEFLAGKVELADYSGFEVEASNIHPSLFPHQRDMVMWATRLGRGLIAASFGLGKSVVQLELARLIHQQTGGKFLIVCPLGVKHQFIEEDGPRLDIHFQYVRTDAEIEAADTPYLLTNYERVRDGDIDPRKHNIGGCSLDEGSVLRSLGSKTYEIFLQVFANVPYRYVCTATPAPNRFRELIYYAKWLGVMDYNLSLNHWFKRNPNKANDLTLHPQHEADFWLWIASWALFLYHPSDLGYDTEGYDLPELRVHYHRIGVDQSRAWEQTDDRGQHRLFLDAAGGVREASAEKRATIDDRVERMTQIVSNERVLQGVLPEEQRKGQDLRSDLLSEKQGKDQGEKPTLAEGKSRTLQGTHTKVQRRQSGKSQDPQSAMVHRQQEESKCYQSEEQTSEGIRSDCGGSGPRSSNEKGQGSSLPTMQCSIGAISGEHPYSGEGGGLPTQFVIWCHLNDEQRIAKSALEKMGLSVSSIQGSLPTDEAERRLYEWKDKYTHILLSKPEMLGSGLNLQQCHKVVFLGIDYRFQDFIQAIHRNHRFLQNDPVDVHIIYAESEDQILESLKHKWAQHDILVGKMREIIRKYGLTRTALSQATRRRSIGVVREQVDGKCFTAIHNDCVAEIFGMADNSVDLLCTSIPFGNHFQYTDKKNDFGYNDNDNKFWLQMEFLIPELLRTLKPGRVAAIHVKDRILYGHQTKTGFMEVSPFSDECVMAFRKHGFMYEGRRTVVTDVVRENNSTYRLGWSEMCKDATKMGSGLPEYILLFRKPPTSSDNAYADEPVTKSKDDFSRGRWQVDAHSEWRSNGNRLLTPAEYAQLMPEDIYAVFKNEQLTHPYDYDRHIEICEALDRNHRLPASVMLCPPAVTRSDEDWVWDDVNFMHGLNTLQSLDGREKHICPLPFDVVRRVIRLCSNEGDIVFDPFGGLLTTAYVAIEMNRRAVVIELNRQYFDEGVRYCKNIELKALAPTFSDWLEQQQNHNGNGTTKEPLEEVA